MSKKNKGLSALAAVSAMVMMGVPAAEAALVGVATDVTGGFAYEGLGELLPGNGIGTGFLVLGDCAFDGSQTVCTISGNYTEAANSSNDPGATGSFVFRQIFPSATNPVQAQSIEAGSNNIQLLTVGNGFFSLDVTTGSGESFSGIFPDDPFENSIGFNFFGEAASQVCTGLTSDLACSIANVGLIAGATIAGQIETFSFSIPEALLGDMDVAPIPLPAGAWLFIGGAGAIYTARRQAKRSKTQPA